jgi:divalent metal cation (Fe/Co/Zn/Cd) transporter
MHAPIPKRLINIWSLIVAIVLFGIGGGISFFEGVTHVTGHVREGAASPLWNYAVIAIALVAEGVSRGIAVHQLWPEFRRYGIVETIREAKGPTVVTVLLEDSAALVGLLFALLGVWLTEVTGSPVFDGIASILIGLMLAGVSAVLAFESRSLLIGETADPEVVAGIRDIVAEDPDVSVSGQPLTMHFGPDDILPNLDVRFHKGLPTEQIMGVVDRLEQSVRERYPQIRRIFIEAESLRRDGSKPPLPGPAA